MNDEMSLSSSNAAEKEVTVQVSLNEATANHLKALQSQDGITTRVRIRNIIKQLAKNDAIGVYRG